MQVGAINRTAGAIGMVGGLLLTLSGAVGMVSTLQFIKSVLESLNLLGSEMRMLFNVLIFLAALGGITVMIGGYLIYKDFHRIGKILVVIGCGVGLLGLLIQAFLAWINGSLSEFKTYMTSTFQGIGILLSIICVKIA